MALRAGPRVASAEARVPGAHVLQREKPLLMEALTRKPRVVPARCNWKTPAATKAQLQPKVNK